MHKSAAAGAAIAVAKNETQSKKPSELARRCAARLLKEKRLTAEIEELKAQLSASRTDINTLENRLAAERLRSQTNPNCTAKFVDILTSIQGEIGVCRVHFHSRILDDPPKSAEEDHAVTVKLAEIRDSLDRAYDRCTAFLGVVASNQL